MLEGQGERLRKDNLALQRRLQAALAALATYGSPLAGPGGLAARMAQVGWLTMRVTTLGCLDVLPRVVLHLCTALHSAWLSNA